MISETKRPFRIWSPQRKAWLRGRNYATREAAIERGLVLTYWEKVGTVHEVIDVSRGHRWVNGFRRGVHGVLLQEAAQITLEKGKRHG